MHICQCYHVFHPVIGGVETNIFNVSSELIKHGHQVTVATSTLPNEPEEEMLDGIRILRTKPLFEAFKVPFLPSYGKLLSKVSPDIIHAHGMVPGVTDIAIAHASKNKIPSVLTYHFDGNGESFFGEAFASLYNHTLAKKTVSKADAIIATTRSYAETSPVLKDYLDKVEIIPNGVDLKKFNPNVKPGDIRKKYKLPSGKLIFCLGRFVKYKGFEYLIRAMRSVDDATLMIGGAGTMESYYRQIVHSEGLETKVRFLGVVPDEDLPKLYRASDVFVLPSALRGEAFGVTLLEAMACGTPVVASDLPGVKELFTDKCGLKTKPGDTKELADSINRLLSDDAMRSRMSRNARKNAEKYAWVDISKKIVKFYNAL